MPLDLYPIAAAGGASRAPASCCAAARAPRTHRAALCPPQDVQFVASRRAAATHAVSPRVGKLEVVDFKREFYHEFWDIERVGLPEAGEALWRWLCVGWVGGWVWGGGCLWWWWHADGGGVRTRWVAGWGMAMASGESAAAMSVAA